MLRDHVVLGDLADGQEAISGRVVLQVRDAGGQW
jgi:hypothetical protein